MSGTKKTPKTQTTASKDRGGSGQGRGAAAAADIEHRGAHREVESLDGCPAEAVPEAQGRVVERVRGKVVGGGCPPLGLPYVGVTQGWLSAGVPPVEAYEKDHPDAADDRTVGQRLDHIHLVNGTRPFLGDLALEPQRDRGVRAEDEPAIVEHFLLPDDPEFFEGFPRG